MPLPNVNIQKKSGLGRSTPNADNVSGLIAPGPATSGGGGTTALPQGKVVQLNSILDAQGYGINRAYDSANSVLVYEHIYKFFKRCPSATFYLMLVPQRLTLVAAVGATSDFDVTTGAAADDTLMIAIGAINLFAEAITLGANTDTDTAIAIVAAINAYTGTSGCSAIHGSGGAFTVTLPSSLGALGNGITPVITKTGIVVLTGAITSGGVTQVGTIPIVVGVAATDVFTVTTGGNTAGDTWSASYGSLALVGAPVDLSGAGGSVITTAETIVAAINAYTGTSGCTAVHGAGGVYTVTLPVGLGASLNGTNAAIVDGGAVVCTDAGVSGGVTAVTTQAVTLSMIMDLNENYAPYMLRNVLSTRAAASLPGGIRQLGAVLNPDATALAAETATSGISDDITLAVARAQALATYAYAAFYPVDIMLEGRYFNATPTNALNMRGLGSGQVSVVIGQDPAISSQVINSTTPYQYYAALGDALGGEAQRAVDASIGDTTINLTDTSDGTFLTANLSSGQPIDNYSTGVLVNGVIVTGLDTLYDKGYIIPRTITGLNGIYWGGGPTCTDISEDDAFIENSRTLNKASIYIRQAFLPWINKKIPIGANGAILPTTVAQLQDAAEKKLDTYMTNPGEISGRSVTITTTDVNGNPINFIQSGEVVPYVAEIEINGIAREITGTVALVSQLS